MLTEVENVELGFYITKNISHKNLAFVASWITESGDLPKISSINNTLLYPEQLLSWFETSEQGIIVKKEDIIIGIATLTNQEASIPSDSLEICHCIVHPEYRRMYNGSSMIIQLMGYAKHNGFKKTVGRVVSSNPIGKTLLQHLHWKPSLENFSDDSTVIWLQKEFS